eukprot:832319-Rhodomonas_salina.5
MHPLGYSKMPSIRTTHCPYTLSFTVLAHAGSALRMCYAVFCTEAGNGATRQPSGSLLLYGARLCPRAPGTSTALQILYAISGTYNAYAANTVRSTESLRAYSTTMLCAVCLPVPPGTEEPSYGAYPPTVSYAMPGTDIAYGGIRVSPCYNVSGTHIAQADTTLHDRYAMHSTTCLRTLYDTAVVLTWVPGVNTR